MNGEMDTNSGEGPGLSAQQKLLWRSVDKTSTSNAVALVRLEGPLRPEQLLRALSQVVARHEVLRTGFRLQSGADLPSPAAFENAGPEWEPVDLTRLDSPAQSATLHDLLQRERDHVFDLGRGPLVRASLVDLGPARSALILTLPALAADLPSLAILIREIGSIYGAQERNLSERPLRYAQFAEWQAGLLESIEEGAAEGKNFWRRQLDASPAEIGLPRRGDAGGFRPGRVFAELKNSVPERLESLATRCGASVETVLLAGWQTLLWRLGGQPRFNVWTFATCRPFEELEQVPGPMGKFLPIPACFDGEFSFEEVVRRVHASREDALAWQEYYLPGAGAAGGFAAAFEYSQLPAPETYSGVALTIEQLEVRGERFSFKLSAEDSGGALRLMLDFDESLFERDAVERWSGHFQTLLAGALENPEMAVSRLPVLSAAERRQLLEEWNATAVDYPRDRLVHELIETQAARTPDRHAVRCGDRVLSYRELNERANQVAHFLRRSGVGPDNLVGLCVNRSVEMIVGLLAILKAGAAYVPLEPDNPAPRLARQLEGAAALITETSLLERMPAFGGLRLCLDAASREWDTESIGNPEIRSTPESLVYVIFTSGSTGTPKGVGVRHRNLVNYTNFIRRRLELDRYPQGLNFATVSTLSADLGNTAIFPALMYGGCVHVIPERMALDTSQMARYSRQYPIDVLKIVPSHLEALLASAEGREILPGNYLILGGEALAPRLVKKITDLGAACEIGNHYGPTETTVESVVLRLRDYMPREDAEQGIPIGKPVDNTRIYILDARLDPVPIGFAGELYIAGDGVAAGYIGQPELTRERFVDDPFFGGKMYRTGDLCRYLADGNVDFLGRADDQVKVRGFRIELGEIEAVLTRHPAVKQAIVIARPDGRSGKRLIGYVAGSREQPAAPQELRNFLAANLPDYMVPAAIVMLPRLPLNANGKIDRQNLPEPDLGGAPAGEFAAPATASEQAIASIWAEVLGRSGIGIDDNFFDLGGHSLAAIQLVARVRERLGVTLDIQVVFDSPTVRGIAAAVEAAAQTAGDAMDLKIAPVSRDAYRVKTQ
jgi:amino acid adenylation domain-containing protein